MAGCCLFCSWDATALSKFCTFGVSCQACVCCLHTCHVVSHEQRLVLGIKLTLVHSSWCAHSMHACLSMVTCCQTGWPAVFMQNELCIGGITGRGFWICGIWTATGTAGGLEVRSTSFCCTLDFTASTRPPICTATCVSCTDQVCLIYCTLPSTRQPQEADVACRQQEQVLQIYIEVVILLKQHHQEAHCAFLRRWLGYEVA